MPKGRFFYDAVTLKVEDDLYRVPRHHLETWSQVFKDMFALPSGPDAEGHSEENPIVLSGCTSCEFDSLMVVMLNPSFVKLSLSKEQWVAILKLATMWEIPEVRALAIEKLSGMDSHPSELVVLGKRYNVRQWFVNGIAALLVDKKPETTMEHVGSALGWELAARIAWASRCIPPPPQVAEDPLKLAWSCAVCSTKLTVACVVPDRATIVNNAFEVGLYRRYARCLRVECFCPNSGCPGVNLNQVRIELESPASFASIASSGVVLDIVQEAFANELKGIDEWTANPGTVRYFRLCPCLVVDTIIISLVHSTRERARTPSQSVVGPPQRAANTSVVASIDGSQVSICPQSLL